MTDKLQHAIVCLCSAAALTLTGCDAGILEDGVPCDPAHTLSFKYDHNMLYTDIFHDVVTSVRVWGFDSEGNLAWTKSEAGAHLARPDFKINLDDVEPGVYSVVAWCGIDPLRADTDFVVPELANGDHISKLTCRLATRRPNVSDTDLSPLFFGRLDGVEVKPRRSEPQEGKVYDYEVSLMKDTNHIYFILRDERGHDITVDNFVYSLTESNGVMSHTNDLLESDDIAYTPWQQSIGVHDTSRTRAGQKVALADITTVRLMDSRLNQVDIHGSDGVRVAEFPLNEAILRFKDLQYPGMSDQEFLDRQDEYVVELPVTDGRWIGTHLFINGWKVVMQDIDFE